MARYKGTGVTIEYGDASGGTSITWVAVAQVREVGSGPGGGQASEIDITDHDSTGGYRQFLQGLKDAGTMDFTVNYDPAHASHAAASGLASMYGSGATRDWRITLTDAADSTITFEAYVSQFQPIPQFDDALIANVTLRIAGAVTFP
jgi:predicted secreted protein